MNKELVRQLYLNGLNAAEIAEDLKVTKASVNKCIQRNFKDLKDIHDRNRKHYNFHRKEVQKAIDYESKKYIGDKSFILKNRSIYMTKENGDIVIKKIDCAIPWDVPRRLANEVSCN